MISLYHILGILLAVFVIEAIGIWSRRKVHSADDFSHGSGKAGTWIVAGTILGTLVGGQSTIGTAQLAFCFGLSAWWFTAGAAFGCMLLAIGYAARLRNTGCSTVLEVVRNHFGRKTELTASVLCSIALFISVVAQVLSASALMMTLFPINFYIATLLAVVIMGVYVVFGGLWSAGLGGIVKMLLLCISALAGGAVVLALAGGFDGLLSGIKQVCINQPLGSVLNLSSEESVNALYNNIFSRGPMTDVGSCLSVVLGVAATQTYAQGIWSGKSTPVARKGALIAAFMAIPIGVACMFIGMYMRSHYVTSDELLLLNAAGSLLPQNMHVISTSAQAFPVFVVDCMPKFLGGIMLGTMLITVIVGGAGLTLGTTTILVRDVLQPRFSSLHDSAKNLATQRAMIVAIMLAAVVVALSWSASFINDLGFVSMGLRTTTVFLPLTLALFLPNRFNRRWVYASIFTGTIALLIAHALPSAITQAIDPLFIGLAVSTLTIIPGYKAKKR